jgi:hypothetical protein
MGWLRNEPFGVSAEATVEIGITAVEDQHGSLREGHTAGEGAIGQLAFRHHCIAGQVAIVIQHHMKFHHSFGSFVVHKVKH